MPKFDIPVIVSIEAADIEAARQEVYKSITPWDGGEQLIVKGELCLADDSITSKTNQRIVILHPDDVDNTYDVNAYNDRIKEDEE